MRTKLLISIIFAGIINPYLFCQEQIPPKNTKEDIPQLIQDLGDSDIITNYYAGRKIKKIGKDAVPYLIKALDSPKGKIRIASIFLLEQIKDPRAIPEFIRIFKDKSREEKERAASALALGRIDAKESSTFLIDGLSEDSDTIKSACAMSLGMLKEEKAVPRLIELTKDKEKEIGKISLRSLKQIGDRGIPEIEKLLKEGSMEEKFLSLEILGEIKSEKSIDILRKALKDENKYIAICSAYILSVIGNNEGNEIAKKLVKDTDPKIKVLAVKTLENITNNGGTK